MIKLIKNELYKLIHKTSTYIFLAVIFAFVILINIIYKQDIYETFQYEYYVSENEIDNEIAVLDKKDPNYINDYASLLAQKDIAHLNEKYQDIRWKRDLINGNYQNVVSSYYNSLYITEDLEETNSFLNEKKVLESYLEKDNWQDYTNYLINENKMTINSLNIVKKTLLNNDRIKETDKEIEYYEYLIKLEEYRIDNNIPYDYTNYLSNALEDLESSIMQKKNYDIDKLSEGEKETYNNLLGTIAKDEYIISHKVDLNNGKTLRSVLINFFNEYSFFIIIFVLMIGASILSEEFNKGTIKSLLIAPYKRKNILASKFITSLLIIPIITLIIILFELLVGGFVFGFSSLSIPVVFYNTTKMELMIMPICKFILLSFIGILPEIILLLTLAFTLSVLIPSAAFALMVTISGWIGSSLINSLAVVYNLKFLRYFVTLNWNYNDYLFGNSLQFKYVNFPFSIIICIIYETIMLVVAFIVFRKKNVKNI